MLRVPIRKDIAEYKSKFIGKMSVRTIATVAIAVISGLLIGAYMYFALGIEFDTSQWIIVPVGVVIWTIGIVRPMNFSMEEFIPLWSQHHLTPDRCEYVSSIYLLSGSESESKGDISQITSTYKRLRSGKGAEALSPTDIYCNSEEYLNER